jgi:DnaJ-class molecular chaperone
VAGASRAFKSSAGKVFFEGVHSSSGYGPQGQQAPGPQRDTKAELRAAYKLIGVKKSCEDAELKSAYRKLAMQWHPDRHQEPAAKAEAEEKFKKISAAYELIIKSREKGTA